MSSDHVLAFHRFQLDPGRGQLRGESGAIPLTPKAMALLEYLIARAGRLVSKQELLDSLWPRVFVGDGALKVCIREIRRALGEDIKEPRFIETAHRRGYRFIAPIMVLSGSVDHQPSMEVRPATAPIQYARSGRVNIAYQVLGNGPIDVVFVMGWVSHLEYFWKEPSFARFLTRLASFSRLILFDKRGTGLSDPVAQLPTLEQHIEDVRAVMEAVASPRAALLGVSDGGPMCSLFAASYPAKTEALIMIGTSARRLRAPDYPWAPSREQREAFLREVRERWGGPVGIDTRAPSQARNQAFRDWWSAYLRMGASPATAVALTRMNLEIDVRHVLPTIRVPTLVLHRTGDRSVLVEEGRYVASLIPDARFVELAGDDHLPFVGDQEALLDQIQGFLSSTPPRLASSHVLATVVCWEPSFGTARRAASFGALDRLHAIVTGEVQQSGGGRVERSDGHIFGVFDAPARAIRCGRATAAEAERAGLRVRVGVHTGECDAAGGVAGGSVARVCVRVAAVAAPGELLVTRTVVDLVSGSGLKFDDRGKHRLAAGMNWRLFAVGADHSHAFLRQTLAPGAVVGRSGAAARHVRSRRRAS
jgi:pimeloyl-ACP methyl ester carboxylesterase